MAHAAGVEADLSSFGLETLSLLGRGHFGEVQLVREVDTEQQFVAKCVKLDALNEHDKGLAHQEVFLLEALEHPHIVAYYDSFLLERHDVLVILMEHCGGGDLRQAIAAQARVGTHFSEARVMAWFVQVALALQYLHTSRVLHRDLKPSNVFLADEGSALKLGDFGISRILDCTLDAASTLVGTPCYMSPEVCSDQPYSWKSDVWAAGCVLYELCALKHAFADCTLPGLVWKIVQGAYEPLPPPYTQDLQDLVQWLLATSVELRPLIHDVVSSPFVQTYTDGHRALAAPPEDGVRRRRKEWRSAPPPPEAGGAGAPTAPPAPGDDGFRTCSGEDLRAVALAAGVV